MDFGTRLRDARERRGKSLRDIAESTKISPTVLEALEHNELGRVPGGIFARAFVRAYAAEVGLDPDQTLREFLQMRPDAAREPAVADSDVARGRRLERFWIGAALVAIGVTAAAAAFWAWRARGGGEAGPGVPAVWLVGPAAGAEGGATSGDGAGEVALTARGGPPERLAPAGPLPGRPVPAAAAADLARGPVAADVAGAVAHTWRIAIHPSGPCWVRLVSHGQVLLARELRAGDREERQVTGAALLEVGDAAVFAFSINDRPGRVLGRAGQVVRIRLGPDTLESFLER